MDYLSPAHLLEDVQLTLENESRFYDWCLRKINGGMNDATSAHWRNALKYYYKPAEHLSTDQRIYLRKYFTWRWIKAQQGPEPEHPDRLMVTTTPKAEDPYGPMPFESISPNPVKETAMSTALKFNTVFLLNGMDVSKMDTATIYGAIEAEEARIEKLKKIKNQPKSLINEINAAEAQLQALIAYLDAQ